MTRTNRSGLRGLLVLALVLGLASPAAARPGSITGTLSVGWAFGEIVAIGDYNCLGLTGPMADATRAANGLTVTLDAVFRTANHLDVFRIALAEQPEGSTVLAGVLTRNADGALAIGGVPVRPVGPLAKALERCSGLDLTVTGETDDTGALNIRSIGKPLPEGWPWLF
jgi:hypothetical protein